MTNLHMTSAPSGDAGTAEQIYCPALYGLTARQADLAFLMPRLDHNRAVRETRRTANWAALLASDPFGSEDALFASLSGLGYTGILNWPSSILLDGAIRQSMSTIPASPQLEYEFLARAQKAGFETLAFFLSLAQARDALTAGLRRLVLHPGLFDKKGPANRDMVLGSLQRLIETIKADGKGIEILAYTSKWHEDLVPLSALDVDGLVWCEADA